LRFSRLRNCFLAKAIITDTHMLWKISERIISPMAATFFLVLLNDEQITERLTPESGEIGFWIAEIHPEIIRVKVQSGDGFDDFVF
jgi:hypothetical protein